MGGALEVVVGSMFSGKTEELIRRIRRAQIARQKVQVFKPKIDTRYCETSVTSHNQEKIPSVPVEKAQDILDMLDTHTQVVGIDEGQFFDADLVRVATMLADRGLRVIVAGLDTDWKAQPFEPMPTLMAIADQVTKQHAVCVVCGNPASRTQRVQTRSLTPDKSTDKVLVGATEFYEARCRHHFKPELLEPAPRYIEI